MDQRDVTGAADTTHYHRPRRSGISSSKGSSFDDLPPKGLHKIVVYMFKVLPLPLLNITNLVLRRAPSTVASSK